MIGTAFVSSVISTAIPLQLFSSSPLPPPYLPPLPPFPCIYLPFYPFPSVIFSTQSFILKIAENTPSNIMYESNSRAVAAELSKLQNDIFSEKKKVENTDSTASSDDTSPKSESQSSSSAADDSTNVEDGVGGVLLERFIYPLGSVVATVDIEFVAEEDYDTTLPGKLYNALHEKMFPFIFVRVHLYVWSVCLSTCL